jgi:hypothetical protein
MEDKVKLKHLSILVSENIDYPKLMIEVLNYKNSFFNKTKNFTKSFQKIYSLVSEINKIKYETLLLNKESAIVNPTRIGHICYLAMLELINSINNPADKENISEHMAHVIAIACYEQNKESKFDSKSKSFKNFKQQILNQPLLDMAALHYWVISQVKESNKKWEQKFNAVHVADEDAEKGGISELKIFNVITTLGNICKDFNYSEKEAWYIPYSFVQENSYKKAYEYFVQDRIRQIKEAKILANQRKK